MTLVLSAHVTYYVLLLDSKSVITRVNTNSYYVHGIMLSHIRKRGLLDIAADCVYHIGDSLLCHSNLNEGLCL